MTHRPPTMPGAPLVVHVFPSFAVGGAQMRFAALAKELGLPEGTNIPLSEMLKRRYGMQAGNIIGTGSFIPDYEKPDLETGQTRIGVRLSHETLWISQRMIADLFQGALPESEVRRFVEKRGGAGLYMCFAEANDFDALKARLLEVGAQFAARAPAGASRSSPTAAIVSPETSTSARNARSAAR